jgi:hypothetical protein
LRPSLPGKMRVSGGELPSERAGQRTTAGSTEHKGGQIIGEVQKGYKLGDRVLRPALVRVAKGKPASEAEAD